MARGPSQGTVDRVNAILAQSRMARQNQPTIAQRSQANYQAAQPRNDRIQAQAAHNWGVIANTSGGSARQRAAQALAGHEKSQGGLGGLIHDVGGGLGDVLHGLDTGRAAVLAGATQAAKYGGQFTHDIGLNDYPDKPLDANTQANQFAVKAAAAYGSHDMNDLVKLRDTFLAQKGAQINLARQEWEQQYDPSVKDFNRMLSGHTGFNDALLTTDGQFDKKGNPKGTITGNKVTDFGLGLAGDIAYDPLAKIMPAHLSTEAATGKAIEATNLARAEGNVQAVMRGEGIVARLGRTKTVAGLSADDLKFIGLEGEGGYRAFGRFNLGGQDFRSSIYDVNPLPKARVAVGDALDKGGLLGRGSINGAMAKYKAQIRSGVAQDAWSGTVGLRGERAKNLLLGSVSADLRAEGNAALKESGLKPDELLDAFHGLQGDTEAAARVGADRLKPLQNWYEKAAQQYEEATGTKLNRLEDYVNRRITDEMRARIGTKKGSLGQVIADFAKHREIGPGSELFGQVVPEGLTPSGVIKWANQASEDVLGHGMYKTDLAGLMDSYAHQVGKAVGVARRNTLLEQAGLLTQRGVEEVAPNAEKVAAAGEKVAAREGAIEGLKGKLGNVRDQQFAAREAELAAEGQKAPLQASIDTAPPSPQHFTPDEWAKLEAEQSGAARANEAGKWFDGGSDVRTMRRIARQEGINIYDETGRRYLSKDALAEALNATSRTAPEGGSLAGKVGDVGGLSGAEQKLAATADETAAEHAAMIVPATPENHALVAQDVTDASVREQERVVKLAQSGKVTPAKVNGYVDASVSFADAKRWAERSLAEEDPLKAHLASLRAQESLLEGQMHAEGIRLSTARDKFTAAQVPGSKLAELTQGALRVQFQGVEHEMHPSIVKLINDTMELTTPKATNAFLEKYDTLLNWIKAWEITSPRFLSHITIGHAWNNALARIEMGSYRDFFAANRAATKGGATWERYMADNPEVAQAYVDVDQMVRGGSHDYSPVEFGVSHGGFREANWNPLSQNNKAFYAVRKGGGNIQHMMRTSLGMDTILRKGGTIDDAVAQIAMYHFDYADLSGFESSVVKRVIPFYTWTRRNMPLQLEMLAKRPSVYSKYNSFTRNVQAVSPPDKGALNLPEYMSASTGTFRTPFSERGSTIYGSDSATPLKELQENPLDWRTYGSMVAPQIKAPIELFAGKQVYKDLPISDKQMALPLALQPIGPVLKGIGVGQTDKDGNLTVSGKVAYALEQVAPMLAVAQRAPGGAKSKGREVTNIVNYALGLGLQVNTPEKQKSTAYQRTLAQRQAKAAASGKTATGTYYYKPKVK